MDAVELMNVGVNYLREHVVQEARRLGLEYLYLGYWIAECPKMSYKEGFRPLEAWVDEDWRRCDRGMEIPGQAHR